MDLDVLLPFHRSDKFLEDAVYSLSKSQGVSLNVILIDDRIDKSKNLRKLFQNFEHYKVVETFGGLGYGKSLEVGSKSLESDVVALFNSDDLVDPLRFRKQLIQLNRSDLSITNMQRISEANAKCRSLAGKMTAETYNQVFLLLGSYGANATWCARREWWDHNVFFDSLESLDWRIALTSFQNTVISYLPENLYFYRKHINQITANKSIKQKDLFPIFDLWEKLARDLGLGSFSYDTFSIFALPWNKSVKINFDELQSFVSQIQKYLYGVDQDVSKNVQQLIARRFLFAIQNSGRISDKLLSLFAGRSQIAQLTNEFSSEVLHQSFLLSKLLR